MAKDAAFTDPAVAAAFAAYLEPDRKRLLALRALIFETAAAEGVGPLEETLKWGQPSYQTPNTKAGSPIRIDALKGGGAALYVNCKTTLADEFRALQGDALRVVGDRAVELPNAEPLPEGPLRHCIALALTYHARKRATAS